MIERENFQSYLKRVSGLPDFIPLSQEEFERQSNPTPAPTPEAKLPEPIVFSAVEREHMAVVAAEAAESERIRTRATINGPQGLTSEQNAALVRESNEERVREMLADEQGDKRNAVERERTVESTLTDEEHLREIATNTFIAQRLTTEATV